MKCILDREERINGWVEAQSAQEEEEEVRKASSLEKSSESDKATCETRLE